MCQMSMQTIYSRRDQQMTTQRQEHESAKNYVLRVLTDDIVNTRLEPGQKLNEPQLCERLGVSRTPFREAELELSQRRLIEIRPKIGTYVSLIDAELVEEVRHLRAVLEAEVARMAVLALTKEDIDCLWENVTLWHMYIERGQEAKIFSLDKEFHRILYMRSGCRYSAAAATGMSWWKISRRISTGRRYSASAAGQQTRSMKIMFSL